MSDRVASRRWAPTGPRTACLLAVLALALAALVGSPSVPVRAAGPTLSASVAGSPFRGGDARRRSQVTLRVGLTERARLRVVVLRYGGSRVRTLARGIPRDPGSWSLRWDGRDDRGHVVPDGPYRLRVTATVGDTRPVVVERWVTKAPGMVHIPEPGSIVVAINPGHGGGDPGARSGRLEEADLNLDVARRVARMLQAAGVRVVMTRSGYHDVNRPAVDVDGNGRIDHKDELVARLDIANLARADLTLDIHENATSCHCASGTETFVDARRPWGARNVALGREVQQALVRRLRAFESRSWHVRDRGLGSGSYVSLSGGAKGGRRPSLMPAVLGEALFIDQAGDHARLGTPAVRTAIAAGYYDAVIAWLRQRRIAVHYSGLEAPANVPSGGHASVHVRVRATGTLPLAGWRLEARLVRRVPILDGSGSRGHLVGSIRLDRLDAGRARDLDLGITMPDQAADWLLKLDLVRGGSRLSRSGIVQPQRAISTVDP